MTAVLLYGPPASGKDTVTAQLRRIDTRYLLYPRLKLGGGRTTGYRLGSVDEVDAMRKAGAIVWENKRYGARYVIDRDSLLALHARFWLVVHVGQVAAVEAVAQALSGDVLAVALWCPRDVAAVRIRARGTRDTAERLTAWEETEPLASARATFDTSKDSAEHIAQQIHGLLREVTTHPQR